MEINSQPVTKTQDEYDFVFANGKVLQLTLDLSSGDRFVELPLRIQVHIGPKPSLANPDLMTLAEDFTIYVAQLISLQHRTRVINVATLEQQEQMKTLLAEMNTSN